MIFEKEICICCHYKFRKEDYKFIRCPACCATRDICSNIAKANNTTREKVKAYLSTRGFNITNKKFLKTFKGNV